MIQKTLMLPLAFILAMRFVTRKQQGIQKVDPTLWIVELDQLYHMLPEGQTWFQRFLINEMKIWILSERLRVNQLADAGVTHIGQLPK